MTKFKRIEIIDGPGGFSSVEGPIVDAWKLGSEIDRPAWLPPVSHTVSLPHIGNPDWQEPFIPGAIWASAAYPDALFVGTPQGWHRCVPMDWITHDDNGSLNVVTADEFSAYYRKAW